MQRRLLGRTQRNLVRIAYRSRFGRQCTAHPRSRRRLETANTGFVQQANAANAVRLSPINESPHTGKLAFRESEDHRAIPAI